MVEIDLRTSKINFEDYIFNIEIVDSRIAGEVVEFVTQDKNSILGTRIDYDGEGNPLEVDIYPEQRMTVCPFRVIPLENGETELQEKTQEELNNEAREKARKQFFAFYSAKNAIKDLPNESIIFNGLVNE